MKDRRKRLSKKQRLAVYEKYGGHCAYCGCELTYKDMQVDHIKSYYLHDGPGGHTKTDVEMNDLDNLLPACRMCNFYKSGGTLEAFRERLRDTLLPNACRTFQFRLAEKYGLVEKHEKRKIFFYFEQDACDKKKGDKK
ncbi:HNH endonuclease [Acidaminococcus sp.]|uniref:HNH endonuclease n=1 Tax=Acidaminococcus sp. TaxID=1872103 RepID=UPI003D7C4EDA